MANQRDLLHLVHDQRHALYELQQDYQHRQRIKPYYHQIRYLDIEGNEIIRVNGVNGEPDLVSGEDLQNMSDRYYFREGMTLSHGSVYLSPLDLNVEHGEIVVPHQPMIRLVSPVVDANEHHKGVLVLSMSADLLISGANLATRHLAGRLMLLNSDGYSMYGAEPGDNWAFMFAEKINRNAAALFPEFWAQMRSDRKGVIVDGGNIYLHLSFSQIATDHHSGRVKLGGGYELKNWPNWKVVSVIPASYIFGQLIEIRMIMVAFYALVVILLGIGMTLIGRANARRRFSEYKTRRMALHDSLTGLPNPRYFTQALEAELARAKRSGSSLALMYMDLDKFKPINDALGHQTGDLALKEVARRLKISLRETDFVARLGVMNLR